MQLWECCFCVAVLWFWIELWMWLLGHLFSLSLLGLSECVLPMSLCWCLLPLNFKRDGAANTETRNLQSPFTSIRAKQSHLWSCSLSLSLWGHTLILLLTSTLTRAPLPMSINPYSLSLERSLIIGREKWKHSRAGCQVSESASEHHFVAEWLKLGSIICQQVSHLVVVFQVEL